MTDSQRPRRLLVTGAASGIGCAVAKRAEEWGWRVIRADRDEGDICADLSTLGGRDELIAGARDLSGGTLDSVIACAGIVAESPATLAVNYFGMVATFAGLLPLLSCGTAPRAVGIASYGAIASPPDPAIEAAIAADDEAAALEACRGKGWAKIYGTSKRMITRWVRHQAVTPSWAGAGVLLNVTGPGIVETPMTRRVEALAGQKARDDIGFVIPLGRPSLPEEQAELLLWLASPNNSYITGQLILSDGGAEAVARPSLI